MDLEDVRLLIRVVELGSIQGASLHFGIPRSSLRRRLEALEAQVGCDLFIRSAAGVMLTSAGTVVMAEGRSLLERSEQMLAAAKSAKGEAAGKLRLVVPVGMPQVLNLFSLRALGTIAAGLSVEQVERPDPIQHLHEPFDVMLHFGDAPTRGTWYSRVIRRFRLTPIASESYLAEQGRPTSLADLARHRVLSWRCGQLDPCEWPLLAGGTYRVHPVFGSSSGELMHRAAQDGHGILLGNPDDALLPVPGHVVPVLDDLVGADMTLRVLSPQPANVDPRTRSVVETIVSTLETLGEQGAP